MKHDIKLQFEPDLEYQWQAIDAVCDLFDGAKTGECELSVVLPLSHRADAPKLGLTVTRSRNQLEGLSTQDILKNLQRVQERNGIDISTSLKPDDWHFTIEMETGTGKTYVYLRTIFELHKRYGFKKFVIIVPSIAVKEGVFKSMKVMQEHFRTLYEGVEMKSFLYDSDNAGRLDDVKEFGSSDKLYVMVSTVQSITDINREKEQKDVPTRKRASRVMYTPSEKTGDVKPIEFIQACKPIVIVDEPQNVAEAGEKGIQQLHPFCTLRYSATHKKKFHPIYCLNAVDASVRKLVKSIEVASVQAEMSTVTPYVKLLNTSPKKGGSAKLAVLRRTAGGGYGYAEVIVTRGTLLGQVTDCADVYKDIVVTEVETGYIRLSHLEEPLYMHQSTGGVNEGSLAQAMIRATIREHMWKELRLRPRGIKVLSLFFIDKVADYRQYDEHRNAVPGHLVKTFEDEYERVMREENFRSLYEQNPPKASDVHGGYFSIDKGKKGQSDIWVDTKENARGKNKTSADTYELIMKDKERLLNLDEPLKFIFSHSALREGWDNPNVFQICVLRDMNSTISRRQAIGRGMRICVNQEGIRERAEDINILTVVAHEDFKTYAAALQKEYEADGVKFGVISKGRLGVLTYLKDGVEVSLGQEMAERLIEDLKAKRLITEDNKPTEELKMQLNANAYVVPEGFEAASYAIKERLIQLTRPVEIKDAHERKPITSRYKKMCLERDFVELWDRIKTKTTYRVKFDTETLIKEVVESLDSELGKINEPLVTTTITAMGVEEVGIIEKEKRLGNVDKLDDVQAPVRDILTSLEDATHLTRKTLSRILTGTKHLYRIRYNEALFEKTVLKVIRLKLKKLMVAGVSYKPVTIGEKEYNAQEIFTDTEGYLNKMVESKEKSIMNYVVWDSDVEKRFAEDAEASNQVKLYVKLPRDFRIPTPLGAYNPDWALVIEIDGKNHLYFVVETKSVDILDDLPDEDQRAKIDCAEKHFKLIGQNQDNPIKYLAPRSNLLSVLGTALS